MKGLLSLAVSLASVSASPVLLDSSIHRDAAPILSASNAQEIADNYIIKFKKHVTEKHAAIHHSWVQDIHLNVQTRKMDLRKRSQTPIMDDIFSGLKHTYNIAGSLLGYSGHFDEDVIEQIRRHPDVELIERDQEVHTLDSPDSAIEKNAPWGLARISHRGSLSFGNFNKYLYANGSGEGVDVYIIDTGTNVDHVDFEGRASWGKTIPQGDPDEDGNGHGTHCSGTVAGKKYGVAKRAHIKAVKVLRSNGSGSMSDVVKGVEYAVESHLEQVSAAKSGKNKKFKGSAANMSLGGGKSAILDQAVNAAVDAGIHFAVAAGNDNADSCSYSPAAADKAVTVGASTLADERAYFSNFGRCNDIFAPGLNIQSTWIGSKYAINTISGTSMASPHIAGLLAYLLSLQPSKGSGYAVADITPKKLKSNLISIATVGALTDVPSSTANILAWNGGGEGNFSSIVEKGNYQVSREEPEEKTISVDFGKIDEEVTVRTEKLAKKINDITGKIESEVAEELEAFFQSLKDE
ncbi:proteinase B [Friedmanniomyces endolithicus]|uniref:Proteinase B n=1 Tax=Friedmanniomyces endolithicus TaxID=329885 RepID=A0A4U0V0P6_9PEZI|nr:proteinase B [Friedmanniomyces endolithicus]KAK0279800.1 proteinase B [Friedmanniomyces endolithicus]KAK0294727.1 proteinase B [Friedmanniomyces endolithicus]KAK0306345.1 proteinase B [Friedmanniomyces endolithicus]KAK0322426.1 proteinase B [Friedmanniomyces endolithicus]